MINTLQNYIHRSLPDEGSFTTNPKLSQKVDENGAFLPFYGNTVVFELDGETKEALGEVQNKLYRSAWWMLSERLRPDTFHVTLHDLVNGSWLTEELRKEMVRAAAAAELLIGQWQGQAPLHLKATWLFNMVNTGIVLGLEPADEDAWHRLSEMYKALEAVVPLGYAWTPHITMAYFKPNSYSQFELDYLKRALGPVELAVELRLENLVYREFSDMNHYESKI